jgi:hypothetical protein
MMLSNVFQKQLSYDQSFDVKVGDEVSHFKQITDDDHDTDTFLIGR